MAFQETEGRLHSEIEVAGIYLLVKVKNVRHRGM